MKTLLFLSLVLPVALLAKKTPDSIEQKLEYVTKVDQALEASKKETDDLKARIRFAPHKNHRKIEYLIDKLKKEQKEAEPLLEQLRIAREDEWSSFKPKLDSILKDMSKDEKEAESLQK